MITPEDAAIAQRFHEEHEITGKIIEWRRNGATQTWKTRPGEFRIPVKYGIRSYGQITHINASQFHRASECPTKHVQVNEDGKEWYGIALAEDSGMTAVHVTTRGNSKYRVGSVQYVTTECLRYL